MITKNYEIRQWQYNDTHDSYPLKYLRYFVVSFDIKPGTAKYLRDDGIWCDVLQCRQYPNGGTFFRIKQNAQDVLDRYNEKEQQIELSESTTRTSESND